MIQSLCAVLALTGLAAWTAGPYTITALGTMVGGDHSRTLGINTFEAVPGFGTSPRATHANRGMSHRNSLPPGAQGPDLLEGTRRHHAGRIAGDGLPNGPSRAFLPSPMANTPEPALFAIAGAALLGFLARRRFYGSRWAGSGSPRLYTLWMWTSLVAAASTSYTITDLGVLPGGSYSIGYAINQSGQVTGYSTSSSGDRAFLWSNGVMTDLGTLPYGVSLSYGYGINDVGQVVGFSGASAGDRAFLWSNGSMSNLGKLSGGVSSYGWSVNASGQVTGYSTSSAGNRAFLWSNGVMSDLGTLPGGSYSYGYGINESGQVTGNSANHAFLWSNGVMSDLGTLQGGGYSIGYAINESGQVTGHSGDHAFLWSNGVMSDLGTLPGGSYSYGYAINDSGQVTGRAYTPAGEHAFIYSDGVMSDLNAQLINGQGWTLYQGRGINDLGQITGTGSLNNQTRAFLLTPVADTPEPATTLLVSAAILAALARRRFPQNPERGSH